MTPRIYTSSFRTGPDATKKQQMLFATDTDYALSEGYKYIRDSKGVLFGIIDEHNLIEVNEADILQDEHFSEPTKTIFDPDFAQEGSYGFDSCCDCEDCAPLSNEEAIDSIINNTLNQAEPLRPTQVDSLLKMAQLKQLLRATK